MWFLLGSMIGHFTSYWRSSACRNLVLDLKMPLTNTRWNGANVLPLRISLFLLNGSISAEYTLDWTSQMINYSVFLSSNGFSSPFSLCSAGFLLLVNRHTHTITWTKDNPIPSFRFVLTQCHLSILRGPISTPVRLQPFLHLLQLFSN